MINIASILFEHFFLSGRWNLTCNQLAGDDMIRDFFFLILFFVLIGVWMTGWLAFHVAGGLIHLLLVFAVISLVMHLFRQRAAS
jgi:hypothetical protein